MFTARIKQQVPYVNGIRPGIVWIFAVRPQKGEELSCWQKYGGFTFGHWVERVFGDVNIVELKITDKKFI